MEELQKGGFQAAMTVSRLLEDETAQAALRGRVLIVCRADPATPRHDPATRPVPGGARRSSRCVPDGAGHTQRRRSWLESLAQPEPNAVRNRNAMARARRTIEIAAKPGSQSMRNKVYMARTRRRQFDTSSKIAFSLRSL